MKAKPFLASLFIVVAALSGCSSNKNDSNEAQGLIPDDVVITEVSGIKVPISEKVGPFKTLSGGDAKESGYAHTEQGAVLAAVGSSTRLSVADDKRWPKLVQNLVAPSPARDKWILARSQVHSDGVDASFVPTIAAVELPEYSEEKATVVVYCSYPDNSLTKTTTNLVWSNNDWKLSFPEEDSSPVEEVDQIPESATKL